MNITSLEWFNVSSAVIGLTWTKIKTRKPTAQSFTYASISPYSWSFFTLLHSSQVILKG